MNKILTWKGRINRLQYLLVSGIIYIVTFLIILILVKKYSVDQTSIYQLPVFIVLLLLNFYLVICNTIKRLNDIWFEYVIHSNRICPICKHDIFGYTC